MAQGITVVIQTHNEAASIAECIESVILFTDSIIVIDTESTDNTVEIAKQYEVEVYTFPFSRYVEPARQFGIEHASGEWVFLLDADERITDELAAEIHSALAANDFTSYKIPRQNIFAKKKWLQYGGWWPDHQIRLIKKSAFQEWPARIHATPKIEGAMGYLNNPIRHFFHGDIEKMVNKTIIFEDIESQLLADAGRDVSVRIFFRKFLGEFTRRFFQKKGFRDGTTGVLESVYQAFSKTITWIFLYEKKNSRPL